ncbi:hypothetical protein HDU78_010373 [Chytriomyces hyalinus]|nr:hypothetical protein HDU78_010373 [Chytriomyces hyalinus]KAJ3260216.1 hypothetical protein HDU77_001501 [Chytriomyces hyalinus]KAJ3383035.1 hypothetical protein HDU80_001334 [Chytriomyces hyalinus]
MKPLTRGEKAFRDDLFDAVLHHMESLHDNQWITTHSYDITMQGLHFDKSDPESAATGRSANSIAASTVDPSKIGAGGLGHSVSIMGRKIAIGNSGPLMIAIEDFVPQEAGDLEFRRGDTLEHVSDVDANWAKGKINGREGLYPKAFVKKRDV